MFGTFSIVIFSFITGSGVGSEEELLELEEGALLLELEEELLEALEEELLREELLDEDWLDVALLEELLVVVSDDDVSLEGDGSTDEFWLTPHEERSKGINKEVSLIILIIYFLNIYIDIVVQQWYEFHKKRPFAMNGLN